MELDGQILQNQLDNRTLLARWQTAHGLIDKQGALWKGSALVVVGNNDLKRGVITLFHDSPTAGHPGIAKTTDVTLLGTLRPDIGGGRFVWLPDDLLVVDYCNLTTPMRVLVNAPMYLVPVLCYISSTEGH